MSNRPGVLRPPWFVGGLIIWLLALTSWEPVGTALVLGSHALSQSTIIVVAALAAIGLVATIAWGFALSHRRLYRELGLSAVAGAGGLLGWYVISMIASDPGGNSGADNAAAVGVIMFAIPTLVVVALLLGIGAGLDRLWRFTTRLAALH